MKQYNEGELIWHCKMCDWAGIGHCAHPEHCGDMKQVTNTPTRQKETHNEPNEN